MAEDELMFYVTTRGMPPLLAPREQAACARITPDTRPRLLHIYAIYAGGQEICWQYESTSVLRHDGASATLVASALPREACSAMFVALKQELRM